MAIEKKLVCFKTQANFDAQLRAGNIMDYSIVFIKDTQKIWTHGVYFTSLKELFEKLNTKQDVLTASENVAITESDGKILISAKDTTYTLSQVEDSLTLKDSSGATVSIIDLSKYVYTLPQATTEVLGGVKIVDTVGEEGVKTDTVTLQTIPSTGKKGQLLSHDGTKGVWVDYDRLDVVSYGVRWKPEVADPHLERVGNFQLHRILPIQSGMRGCVCQGNKIMYWLDERNWNFRKKPKLIPEVDLAQNKIVIPTTDTLGLTNGQHIRILGTEIEGTITQVQENISITVMWGDESAVPAEIVTIEIGSRLDGYDGEVMVYVPEFYIRSWDEPEYREVRISTIALDDTWTYQPRTLVAAYKDTVLNTVPENMGYLSKLPQNSAISVVNREPYCRGGDLNETYDSSGDKFRGTLGKCRTNLTRGDFRTYARNAGKEIMSYEEYKNIIYWLYVIEYANFNAQTVFTTEPTPDGFRRGGIGEGIVLVKNATDYNNSNPICPNGFTNHLGNSSGVVPLTIPEFTFGESNTVVPTQTAKANRWRGIENPYGDVFQFVDGVLVDADIAKHPDGKSWVYTTSDPRFFMDTREALESMRTPKAAIYAKGIVKEWNLGTTADIIPRALNGRKAREYKCDYYHVGSKDTLLRLFIMGGYNTAMGAGAGIGCLNSANLVQVADRIIGCRTVCRDPEIP